jgi:hypothetical protein
MITTEGDSITRETAAHKYGGDPMAEYLDRFNPQDADEYVTHPGEVSEGAMRFGRRLLWWDDAGFVYVHRHDTLAEAEYAMAEMVAYYDDLDTDDEGES